MAPQSPTLIEKEEVNNLNFPQNDVLEDDLALKITRRDDIMRAMRLGNNQHYKVKIVFEDTESKKTVNTTIWAVTEKRVVLKGGAFIPVHRIYTIEYNTFK